jgi:diaminopimelate decarboxylase
LLLTRVIEVKRGRRRTLVLQDGAMNDLIRPTLYEAWHPVLPVREPSGEDPYMTADVVGPVCESGDYLALDRRLPETAAGDLLAIGCAGAYGAVMSSTYNSRPLVPEVLVSGVEWAVIRPRQSLDALIGLDRLPGWLDR